jgi:prophage DNA circulation protein
MLLHFLSTATFQHFNIPVICIWEEISVLDQNSQVQMTSSTFIKEKLHFALKSNKSLPHVTFTSAMIIWMKEDILTTVFLCFTKAEFSLRNVIRNMYDLCHYASKSGLRNKASFVWNLVTFLHSWLYGIILL